MTSWGGMVRRSSGGIKRKEDEVIFLESGKYILDGKTKAILTDIYQFICFDPVIPCSIIKGDDGGDVRVILDEKKTRDVTVTLAELEEELNTLEEELKSLEALKELLPKSNKGNETDELLNRIARLNAKIEKISGIIGRLKDEGKDSYVVELALLGYYKRRPDPEIHLMMKTLGGDDQLTAIVFVHELMHAYFDMHKPEVGHPCCPSIEEPIAEYGMLSFMDIFERHYPKYDGIFNRAIDHVRRKQDELGTCHYGFGYYLYCDKAGYGADWISLFHSYCPVISVDSPEVKAYESFVSPIKYPASEWSCEERLYKVLKPRRFCFVGETTMYKKTTSCKTDRMLVNECPGIGENVDFKVEYLRKGGTEITLQFECKDGTTFKGSASVCKSNKGLIPPRINFHQDLLIEYVTKFRPNNHATKQFCFYEIMPSYGGQNAEWIAKEL